PPSPATPATGGTRAVRRQIVGLKDRVSRFSISARGSMASRVASLQRVGDSLLWRHGAAFGPRLREHSVAQAGARGSYGALILFRNGNGRISTERPAQRLGRPQQSRRPIVMPLSAAKTREIFQRLGDGEHIPRFPAQCQALF